MKDFVAINFSESRKKGQNLKKVTKSFHIFLTRSDEVQPNSFDNCIHLYNVKISNLFDPELQLIITKSVIKNKLKGFLSELKKLKFGTVLVLDYKKRNGHKIFHSSTKLTTSFSYSDEAFKSIRQDNMSKIRKYAFEDWIVLDAVIGHSIKIFEC